MYVQMVIDTEERTDAVFHALADRTRRDILRRVLIDEHSVTSLAARYDMSFAAVQKHVAVLERAGLITKRRRGREQLATGEVTAVRDVSSMLTELEQIWRGRISRIDQLLAEESTSPIGLQQKKSEFQPLED
ncbi:metalloregulator ArsR/SmtB family transcription factor [Gordonia jinhuaensis]